MDELVIRAQAGDKMAVSALLDMIREPVYQMALRMLGYPSDAEDAVQEILIRILTRLSTFRGHSSFNTWAYRIAVNHLLNIRRKRADHLDISFQSWEGLIYGEKGDVDLAKWDGVEQKILVNEVRTGCLQGLLLCLEKKTRIAFLLGDVFEFSSREGARILGITPETFRKRVSRGRERIRDFMIKNCGLFSDKNPCKCREQAERDIHMGIIDPDRLDFTDKKKIRQKSLDMSKVLAELDDMEKMITLFRTYPRFSSPESSADLISTLIASGRFRLFE